MCGIAGVFDTNANEEGVRSVCPAWLRRPLFGLLGRVYPKADRAPPVLRAKSTFEALARDSVAGYFHGVSHRGDRLRQKLFSDKFRRELQGDEAVEVLREHDREAQAGDPLSRIQYLDFKTWLPADILTKVDRASMAHSLEVRVPLLDHELVEWIAALPPAMKLRGHEGKYLFKRALEPHVGHDVLYRRKMGFSVPLASWFRGPLRERVRKAVLGPVLNDTGLFNNRFLQQLVDQHQSGVRDHSTPIFALVILNAVKNLYSRMTLLRCQSESECLSPRSGEKNRTCSWSSRA